MPDKLLSRIKSPRSLHMPVPSYVQIEPTFKCNLSCLHCFRSFYTREKLSLSSNTFTLKMPPEAKWSHCFNAPAAKSSSLKLTLVVLTALCVLACFRLKLKFKTATKTNKDSNEIEEEQVIRTSNTRTNSNQHDIMENNNK